MSDTIFTAILVLAGIAVLAVSSVILALRSKGDRTVTWSGFGVCFSVTPCSSCKLRRKGDQKGGEDALA